MINNFLALSTISCIQCSEALDVLVDTLEHQECLRDTKHQVPVRTASSSSGFREDKNVCHCWGWRGALLLKARVTGEAIRLVAWLSGIMKDHRPVSVAVDPAGRLTTEWRMQMWYAHRRARKTAGQCFLTLVSLYWPSQLVLWAREKHDIRETSGFLKM